MSDKAHLLIPFAACSAPGCHAALPGLALPNLRELLRRLALIHTDSGDEYTLSPPHERALARARGVIATDGCIPWAAMQAREPGNHAWAFITPCHWQVHSDHITLSDPQALQLQDHDSRALLAAMQPYFHEDGITLQYDQPNRWLARSEVFRNLACASLDRVSGRNIDAWMPEAAQAAPLRRLQNEMQMLLYTHGVNDERAARGLLPVNSFWVSGAGALNEANPAPGDDTVAVAQALREPALSEDWAGWAQAWQQLDANECKALLERQRQGGAATLTLCGERNAQTFEARPKGWLQRIAGQFGSRPASLVLEQL